MKIGQQPDTTAAATQAAQAVAPRSGQNVPAGSTAAPVNRNERKAPPAPGVGVTVSDAARALESGSNETADVDLNKVNAMRQAIAQNSFSVSPEAIADKLLAGARETLGRTTS